MMKAQKFVLLMIAAIVVSLSASVGAQDGSARAMGLDESEALKTAQRWALLVSEADIGGLNELLLNNYMHIHATALVESKDKFIEALKTGARKYDPIKIEDSNVRIFGDSAVVTGKFALKATTRERVIESVNRFGLLLIKTQRGIQVASFQATLIPQPK
jgi:hypothetical protein